MWCVVRFMVFRCFFLVCWVFLICFKSIVSLFVLD